MIRDATIADVPALVAMGQQFRAELYAETLGDNPAQLAAMASHLITSADGLLLVAEDAGALVAMIGFLIFPHFLSGERTGAEVFWYVDPAKRGIGVRLLKRAEAWAIAHGVARIQLVAPTRDVGVLYERLGYQPMETAYMRTVPAHG